MNDRIFEALTRAGLSTSPLSTLDHASASASTFFALYDEELVYHEASNTSRVPLRDVTRIHSDREGVLRVETSDRTAVTASLLGYDPGRVQAFFQQVRDVTARAKELPVLPLNQAKVQPAVNTLTGSSVPASGMPGLSAYTPAVPPVAPVVVMPATPANTVPASPSAASPSEGITSAPSLPPVDPAPVSPTPVSPPSSTSVPVTPMPVPARPDPVRPLTPRPEPVVISSMPPVTAPPAFQERAGERNRPSGPATPSPVAVTPAVSTPPAPTESPVHTQGPLVSVPAYQGSEPAPELLRHAENVQGLARTVGLLAGVLGLAALALAVFQWRNGEALNAIWTLLIGGVGMVALLAFAEALRLLGALARGSQSHQE